MSMYAIIQKKCDFRLFCGSANRDVNFFDHLSNLIANFLCIKIKLGDEIARHLQVPVGECRTERYPDGEIKIRVDENVRGKDAFIVQPTCPPNVNDNLMEIILLTRQILGLFAN